MHVHYYQDSAGVPENGVYRNITIFMGNMIASGFTVLVPQTQTASNYSSRRRRQVLNVRDANFKQAGWCLNSRQLGSLSDSSWSLADSIFPQHPRMMGPKIPWLYPMNISHQQKHPWISSSNLVDIPFTYDIALYGRWMRNNIPSLSNPIDIPFMIIVFDTIHEHPWISYYIIHSGKQIIHSSNRPSSGHRYLTLTVTVQSDLGSRSLETQRSPTCCRSWVCWPRTGEDAVEPAEPVPAGPVKFRWG